MKNIITTLTVITILTGCEKPDLAIENLNNNTISVYGHGGMGIKNSYPLNSFESLNYCLNTGADGTELDVQMTRDNVLVAFHDLTLEKTTNLTGKIIDKRWAEISQAMYKYPSYTSYQVISLDELFDNTTNIHDYTFTFDCKLYMADMDSNSYYFSYLNAMDKIINKYNLHNNLFVESQDSSFIALAQSREINYKIFIYPNTFDSGLEIAKNMNLHGITMPTENITKSQVEQAHKNGLYVTIWNAHSKSRNIEAINKHPDFIQTDKLNHLIQQLK